MKKAYLAVFLIIAVVVTLVGATTALAYSHNFVAHLSGGEEVPAVDTLAQGQAVFHLSKDGDELQYMLIVANIDDVVAAHIHLAPAGVNGPVVAFLYGPASPAGRFSGVIARGTITSAALVGPLAGQSLSALLTEMRAGNTYVNVHTVDFPNGEIRGQIR